MVSTVTMLAGFSSSAGLCNELETTTTTFGSYRCQRSQERTTDKIIHLSTETRPRAPERNQNIRRPALWVDAWPTPAWAKARLTVITQIRLQSCVSCSTRDWSQDTAQGNGCRHVDSARTPSEAIYFLKNLLQRDIIPDSYTYVKVLQLCLKQNDLLAVKQVHGFISRTRMEKHPYVGSTLLDVYIKCGQLLDARQVFDKFKKKNVVTWNMMIAGYAKSDHAESALELFKLMRQQGVQPNNITYISILKACASPSTLEWGKELHVSIRNAGLESDLRVANALLQMYAKCRCITEATQVFDKMEKRDVRSWNFMIGGLAQDGRGHQAYSLFSQMKREGFRPDAYTYATIFNASASAGALQWVMEIHDHARKAGLESDLRVGNALVHMYAKSGSIDDARSVFDRMEKRDVFTWNIMIGGLAQRGCRHEAYQLLCQMRREDFEPNAVTYTSILKASASADALQWVTEVHGHAKIAGLESDLRVGNALIHMYAKSGSIADARALFNRMEKRDVFTWNAMIGGLAEHGCGHEAYQLLCQMKREGVEPNGFTYISILNASATADALQRVTEVHGHARKAGLESDLRVGNTLIHVYAKSGSIEDARAVFSRMEKRDVITWNVMIGRLAEHGCGHEAYQLLCQMRREGVEPNGVTYTSILNASASADALWWVTEVHGQAREAGLESNLRVGNALIHMYAKSGSIDAAQAVFSRMVKRDVITWNTMIGGLAEHGCGHEAHQLLCQMRREGVEPNGVTYVSILNSSASADALEWVTEVHGHARKAGLESDLRVGNALIHMYAKIGSIDAARAVFSRMEKRDVITWNVMIGGLAEHGWGHEAYQLLCQMRREGVEPNGVTYTSILNASASADALWWVTDVHGQAREAGLESDLRVGNALIHMYAKSGSIDAARAVFSRMEKYDIITWNTMIGGLAEHGCGHEAYQLLCQMRREGVEPNGVTYISILNSSASADALEWVTEVHGHARKAGLESDLRVGNALIHMYAKSGSMDAARAVFSRMEKRDVITWNAMIGGLAEHGCGHEAYQLFCQMRREGVEPNGVTYTSILNASASADALQWVTEVHGHARKAGLESDLRVGNALIHMYAKSSSIDDARAVFSRMGKRDLITWNVMIGGLAEHGCGHEAYQLLCQMRREGVEPNGFTYTNILNASATADALQWVTEVHGQARTAGLESDLRVGTALVHMYVKSGSIDDARAVFDKMEKRDVVTWTVMIGGLAEHGCGHEAYQMFCQMRREGVEPDGVTYTSILNASASAGALQWVTKVHGYARKAGLESDLCVGNALVHMYAKSGSLDDAREVFDRMEKHDVVTWNVMIGGLAQHGCGHEALEYFSEMKAAGVKPDHTTFTAVLSACCHTGRLDDGRRLFLAMTQEHGIRPDIVQYACMVDLLGRAGLLEESKRLIEEMPFEPDAITWRTLLGACRTYGNVELGEIAAKELFRLEPNEASTYVLLSNIYAAAGKRDKQESVRSMMEERGVRKEPGRSWIEVEEKIHEFVIGDLFHAEVKAIYTMLKILTEKLKAEGYIPDIRLVLKNIDEADKESALCSHSEKLAIAYGFMRLPRGEPIRVFKNLRVCSDCHAATKLIAKVTEREIIVRDAIRFHHFKDGVCSCGDYW